MPENVSSFACTDLANCHLLKGITTPFILVLKENDNIFSALSYCAIQTNIPSAAVSAIGAITKVKMGYYRNETKQHEIKLFNETYEIVSLSGNIAMLNAKPYVHIHAGMSGDDFSVVGGHIIDAYSGPDSEFIIHPFQAAIYRRFNPKLEIDTICPWSSK